MTLKTPIKVDIIVHDEKCQQYRDMGMHLPIQDHRTAPCIIYDVSAIIADCEGDIHFTQISTRGEIVQVLMPLKQVAELIQKNSQ